MDAVLNNPQHNTLPQPIRTIHEPSDNCIVTSQDSTITIFAKKIFSSSAGGAVGAFICYPFEGLKKRITSNQAISYKISEIYRGASAFSVSVTLATTSCMMFNLGLKKLEIFDSESTLGKTSAAITSGMLGAVVGSTPVENVILTQQLNRLGPTQAWKHMTKQSLLRPWVGTKALMTREAGFGFVMLQGFDSMHDFVFAKTQSKTLATLAGLTVGVAGAAATQPFDVIATNQQMSDGKLSFSKAASHIFKRDGMKGFWKGLPHRAVLFTGCATIIPRVEKIISQHL